MKERKASVQKIWSSENPPNFDSNDWKGTEALGAGAYGAAYVWYRVDANGLIADRIVVKDTCIGSRHQWVSGRTILIVWFDSFTNILKARLGQMVGRSQRSR